MEKVLIVDGITEKYHDPKFSSNILASNILIEIFKVFQHTDEKLKECEIVKMGSLNEVIISVEYIKGIYPVMLPLLIEFN